MDVQLFLWLNSWNGQFEIFDQLLLFLDLQLFKSLPFMMAFWGLWFWPKTQTERTKIRNVLTATLVLTVPVMVITRLIAVFAPFSPRPLHTPDLDFILNEYQYARAFDGWSSMPSDHASMFMCLAVAFFYIHRTVGIFFIFWAMFVTSIPRVILAYHWPSDILAGWALGAVIVVLLIGPMTRLIERINIVPFFEEREAIGYALLFVATFEVANMFEISRAIIKV